MHVKCIKPTVEGKEVKNRGGGGYVETSYSRTSTSYKQFADPRKNRTFEYLERGISTLAIQLVAQQHNYLEPLLGGNYLSET